MGKSSIKMEGNVVHIGADTNEDGENVLNAKVHMSEVIAEAFAKGEEVEGVKVVGFKFELTKLKVKLDTDKDGEAALEIEIDLAEAADEVKDKFFKKDEGEEVSSDS